MDKQLEDLRDATIRLLKYSFDPIHWDYNALTVEERKCITREQFNKLREWVNNPTMFMPKGSYPGT